jgi:hypothetical protein
MNVAPSLPLTEATVTVDGVEMYISHGRQRPAVLLLHGYTLDGQPEGPLCGRAGKDHTLIIPTFPGLAARAAIRRFHTPEAARLTLGMADVWA